MPGPDAPLARAELEGRSPFWAVTKHEDIRLISRQNDLFHSADRSTIFTTKTGEAHIREVTGGRANRLRHMIHMDAPEHLANRAITQPAFMPGSLRQLEAGLRDLAQGQVARMAACEGACDFAADIAQIYPMSVIMQMLGVPAADAPLMQRLTSAILATNDAHFNPELNQVSPEEKFGAILKAVDANIDEFAAYFARLVAQRRAEPQNDLLSTVANATIDGAPMNAEETMSYIILLVLAGHDTTATSLSTGMQKLCESPELLARMRGADTKLIDGFVDESIRWASPARHFMRSATADTTVRGQHIAAGDWLMLCYPSGNRDEEVFEDPYSFRVDRSPNPHLAFGYGVHKCLGIHLAKLEMRIFWETLLPRLEAAELAGTPEKTYSILVNSLRSMPIRYRLN
ncbi:MULTISPECIES: cytochrome P450 [Rhodomicrobium]|uniref:cytochrome P450 n=1 Tax=Rhodomicrobium TaxID=1068 RepID=UPI001FD934EE|nr:MULTISPECIES: cytochrome P450 [Rhodomicrobium]